MSAMKLHYLATAIIEPGFELDGRPRGFAHEAPCGARSKHGVNVTPNVGDADCPKCLAARA